MRKLLLLIICLNLHSARAQVLFQCNYDIQSPLAIYAGGYAVIRAPGDSGYYAEASVRTALDSGATVTLFDSNGHIQWSKIYKRVPSNGEVNGFYANLISLPDSSLAVNTYTLAGGNTISLKLAYSGNLINAKSYSGAIVFTIFKEQLINNSIYGTGRTTYANSNGGLFCKRNLNGTIAWAKYLTDGAVSRIELNDVASTFDNSFVLAGTRSVYGSGIPRSTVILKTDSSGTIQWLRQFTFASLSATPYRILETQDYGFLTIISHGVNGQSVLMKTDSLGNLQWNYGFVDGSNIKLAFYEISPMGNDRYIVSGYRFAGPLNDLVTVVIDGAGNLISTTQHTNTDNTHIFSQDYNPQQGLITWGYRSGFNTYGYFLSKMDTLFNAACSSFTPSVSLFSNPVSDTALTIPFLPLPVTATDITSLMVVSNHLPVRNDYCFTATEDITAPHKAVRWGPVPSNGNVTFSTNDYESSFKSLQLYDVAGRQVFGATISGNSYELDRAHIQNGIYFFKLLAGSELVTGKIIFN